MSIEVFSDLSLTNKVGTNNIQRPQTYQASKTVNPTPPSVSEKKKDVKEVLKTVLPVAIPIVAIPVTAAITYKYSTQNVKNLKNEISRMSHEITELKVLSEERAQIIRNNIEQHAANNTKANANIWSALIAAAGAVGIYKAGSMSERDQSEVTDKLTERLSGIQKQSSKALDNSYQAMNQNGNNLIKKYAKYDNGIPLLNSVESLNKNAVKYDAAIKQIKEAAPKYLYDAPKMAEIKSENPTIWSVTSEFAPVKEGGLGSVPVELQNNAIKLGVNMPTFIPMYQQKGNAVFKQVGDKYSYTYKGRNFDLEKAISFKVDTFQDGKSKTEDVEIFVNNSKDKDGNDKQLIFIKNDNYFNGTIYQTSEKSEEPEKFAFMSKVAYELAKSKFDINSLKGVKIDNSEVFDSIKAPDAFILNDWQASPVAALARYKAPMENAFGQLSDDAAKKLSEMNIITIGHNAMYQGSTRNDNNNPQRYEATANILNTLFDGYTYDIVENAKTEASERDITDSGLKNLDNVLLTNRGDANANHTNLLNMGICLSNYFHPVSQNYANELISDEHPELSGELRWALRQKDKAGALVGIINGNDYNNLSIEAKAKNIQDTTGLTFELYNKQSDIDSVMKARTANKINMYNNYMMPLSKKNDASNKESQVEQIRALSSKVEYVQDKHNSKLPELTEEQLKETPIITSVGRLVTQKGIPVMTEAIELLMKNWEKEFPGKPKPIFYLAGQDGEGGKQRKYIENLMDKLPAEDASRIIFAHGFVPMSAITASSDFFMMPSMFEPCGLTQGESFAVATPVIGSAVGGIVDTVNRDGKKNGVLTEKAKELTSKAFYDALKKGLDIYFNDKESYQNMVKDSLAEDFSWIQKGKQGPMFEYLEKIGIDTSKLPEVA